MSEPLLQIPNRHLAGCGIPPNITGENPNLYIGYFENPLGEQWVFTYDRQSKQGELRGGDVGWEAVFHVKDGIVAGLVLEAGESAWLKLCWHSATGTP
jgi:hypothetical protein